MRTHRPLVVLLALCGGTVSSLIGWFAVYRPLVESLRPPDEERGVQGAFRQPGFARLQPKVERPLFGEPAAPVKGLPPDADADPAASLRFFLKEFAAGVEGPRGEEFFDARRTVEEFRRAGLVPGLTPRQEEAMRTALAGAKLRALTTPGRVPVWTSVEIRSLQQPGQGEAVVVARHRDDKQGTFVRWWVSRHQDGWRVWDFEDLETGLRLSRLLAGLLPADAGRPAWAPGGDDLYAAARAFQQGKEAEAQRLLAASNKHELPAALAAPRWLLTAALRSNRGRDQEALTCLDKARALQPNLPWLDRLGGTIHSRLGNHEEALVHFRVCRTLLGADRDLDLQTSHVLRSLGRLGEVAALYRKAFDDAADGQDKADALDQLRRALPKGQKRELADRFDRLPDPVTHFDRLALNALRERDPEAAEVYATAMRRLDPGDDLIDVHLARARVQQGRVAEGAALFKMAIGRLPDDDDRKEDVREFLQDTAEAGKPVQGYQAAPTPGAAFRFLAEHLLQCRDLAGLGEVMDAHRAAQPRDVWLRFYAAEAHTAARAYDKADREFAAALADPPDEPARERFRQRRVHALCLAGKGLAAYEAVAPRRPTFAQLAALFAQKKDARQLEALLAAHRKHDRDDPNLPLWEAEARWLAQDYAAVARLLLQHRDTLSADPMHGWKVPQRLIKSLVCTKRFDEARKEAAALAQGRPVDRQDLGGVIGIFVAEHDAAAVELLASAFRKAAPEAPEGFLYLARACALKKQVKEGAVHLRDALARQADPDLRDNYARSFLMDAVDAGQAVEGYRAAPDAAAAFRLAGDDLCNLLADLDRPIPFGSRPRAKDLPDAAALRDGLRRVIEAHRARQPDDVMLHFYTGELHRLTKDYDRAEQEYAAAMARPVDRQLRWRLRYARVDARYRAGKALAAYAEISPRKETFEQLANQCVMDKNAGALAALVAAHRKNEPGDRALIVWDVEAKWLARDYATAVKLLEEHRRGVFADPNHQWKFRDRLVRSLARLKRFDEALKEAEPSAKDRFGDRLLPAVVHALAGDVAKTAAALEESERRGYNAHSFYVDPDLGPLLRSEPFRALRERYPEPKGPPPVDDDDD